MTALLSLDSPFQDHPGVIRLLEPADADRTALSRQLLAGTYAAPFLLDADNIRSLHFSLDFVQSSMRLDAPDALNLPYTEYMMAFLLFHQRVRNIALLGLGGGSLAKFCHRHLPAANLTAVEADDRVIAFRDAFGIPNESDSFRILCADAADFLAASGPAFDVLLVDVFDAVGTAPAIKQSDFFRHARRRLAADGLMVVNLSGPRGNRFTHCDLIAREFGDNLLVASVDNDCNHVVFACRNSQFEPRWKWIDSQASALKSRYGLDFPRIAKTLRRAQERQPF